MTTVRPGTLTGTVVDSHGAAVAGVCVTALRTSASGPSADGRTAVTTSGGMFMITGLRPGPYFLRYRDCLGRPDGVVNPRAAALGPGPLAAPATATRGYVTDGQVTTLGRITLRSGTSAGHAIDRAAGMPVPPAVRFVAAARSRHRLSGGHFGGIAGRVLGPRGRPIKGLCFSVGARGGTIGGPIGADGRYSTGKELPPGTYTVDFSAICSFASRTASANWATEWYKSHLRPSAADPVVIKAGKITRGIGGVMMRGGVIAGIVTGQGGRALAQVCVVATTAHGDFVQQITTPRDGRYRFQGLDPGQYNLGFFPNCARGRSDYLPQWFPGTAKPTKQGLIKTGIGTVRSHVDAKLVLGGTISGVVRFRNSHGHPIKGICVDASPTGRPDGEDFFAASNARGKYSIGGLPAGRYALNFSPGCNNNGNYLSQNYPHAVTARLSRVTGGINAYLQPGAIITGTVTAKSDGTRLRGICVSDADGFSIAATGPDGTYALDQLSPGQTQIQFFNCANKGNFAPQFYPGQVNPAEAASIKLRPGQVVKGIDAAMTPGATISGAISLTTGATPSNVCVVADSLTDIGSNGASTHHGRYVIQDLPAGLYQIEFDSCGGPNIADSFFAAPGRSTSDESRADQLYVPAGGVVASVDAVVQRGGSISGWIYGPKKEQGAFVCPTISDARTGAIVSDFFPAAVGEGYTIWGFAPGRYLVEFSSCGGENLADQWYNRATRPGKATPILVHPGHTTQKVNAWMTVGGTITGRVVNKLTGKPLTGVCVIARDLNSSTSGFGATDPAGKYVVTGLNSGTYRLTFTSCGSVGVVPLRSGVVRVTAGRTAAGPNVAVLPLSAKAGAITGRVSAAGSPPALVADACVDAVPVSSGAGAEFEGGFAATGARGRYQLTGLLPGKYKILIGDPFCVTDPAGLVPQWFRGTSQKSKATAVTVAAGRTTRSINVTLQRDGSISGTVTGPKPASEPLAGICVQVVPVAQGSAPFLAESTAAKGRYQTGPLAPGKYRVEFESGCGATGYRTQWWRGAGSAKTATLVTVRAGQEHLDISASLTKTGG